MNFQARYSLNSKIGKIDCPQCGHRKTLSRYIDHQTGEPLPEMFGRCDRENSCGYHLSPYHQTQDTERYAERLRQQGQPRWKQSRQASTKVRKPEPIYTLPAEVVKASQEAYKANHFVHYIRTLFDEKTVEDLIRRFVIGTSDLWPGACVFWYVDEKGRARSGQVVLFDEQTGRTKKEIKTDGSVNRYTRPVHTALVKHYNQTGEALPQWLTDYISNAPKFAVPFGLHQLADPANKSKPVALVEAPKTAVIATGYLPHFLWMAIGAKGFLTEERVRPLRGRKVVLWPDLGAYQEWKEKADVFGFRISDLLETNAMPEEHQAGLDLADYLARGKLAAGKANPPGETAETVGPTETVSIDISASLPYEDTEHQFVSETRAEPTHWDIDGLEAFFAAIALPKEPVRLDKCTKIVNVAEFVSSHLQTVRRNNGNRHFAAYYDRLQQLKTILSGE